MPFQPFDPQQQMPQQSPYRGQRGKAAVFSASIGVMAGANHYKVDGNLENAANRGVGMTVRVFGWLCLWFTWLVINVPILAYDNGEPLLVVPAHFVGGLGLGVLWCRNSDYALFNRGPLYKTFAPLAQALERIPTLGIYLLTLMPTLLAAALAAAIFTA